MGDSGLPGQAVATPHTSVNANSFQAKVKPNMMQTENANTGFAAFYREQAPAVFDLALRHGGDQGIAAECVDRVFTQLQDHWLRVSDPVRFSRRAAVLYVRGSHRRGGRRAPRCQPVPAG